MPPQLLPGEPDDPLLQPTGRPRPPRSSVFSDLDAPQASPSAPPAAPASSIFSDLQGNQQLATAARETQGTAPSTAARILAVQKKTGYATPLIERNLDDLEKQIAAPGFDPEKLRRDSPALAGWLQEEPQRVALAREELDHLGTLEWLTKVPKMAFDQKRVAQRYSELRRRDVLAGTALSDAERTEMTQLRTKMEEGPGLSQSRMRRWITGLAGLVGDQVPVYYSAAEAGDIGMKAGVVGGAAFGTFIEPGFGTAAGAVLGGGTGISAGVATGTYKGILKSTFDQEFVGAYDEYSSMTDEAGRPMDPRVAKAAAAIAGGINAGLEVWAERLIAKALPVDLGFGANPVRARIRQMLTSPTVRATLLAGSKEYGTTLAKEVGIEELQQLMTIAAREAGVTASNALPATFGNRPDGTPKGEGYLGVLRRPDGGVMTEYSIADSEDPRLRGPNGEHLDYPTLVPTLTPEEVQTLVNLPEGAPVPEAIKQKAEAHALARIAKGEPVFAQAGEQRLDLAPDLPRADTSKRLEHAPVEQMGQELIENFFGSIDAFALGVLPGPAVSAFSEAYRVRAQIRVGQLNQAIFQALADGVTKTSVPLRPHAESFLTAATKGGPVENTYLPTAPFIQYWQTKGVDPNEMATELTGDPKALEHAVKEQSDLRVKTATYAARIAPTEHHAAFENELRLGSPQAPNGRETQQLQEQLTRELADAVKRRDPIQADVAAKLKAAGERSFSADPLSQFLGTLVNTLQGRQALRTADERYASLNVDITREGINDPATRQAQAEGLSADNADAAAPHIPPSVDRDKETRAQRAARQQAHVSALTSVVIHDAQRQDPSVSAAQIRAEVERRLEMRQESQGAALEGGQGHDLLKAIARLGGLRIPGAGQMFSGEVAQFAVEGRDARVTRSGHVLTDNRRPATWNGVAGVFHQERGDTLDGMAERLREEGIQFEGPNDLLEAIGAGMRATASTLGMLPGTAELDAELGITLGTRWWDPGGATIGTDGNTQQYDQRSGVGLQSAGVLRQEPEPGGAESNRAPGSVDGGAVARGDTGEAGRAGGARADRHAAQASSLREFFQRRDGTPGGDVQREGDPSALGEQLPPTYLAAIALYRERLGNGERNVNTLAQAMRDVGARLPMQRAAARELLQHLLDVAHDTTSYSQLPGFYSRLTRAVETSTLAKASGAQWKATIRNAKSGISADEFALTNIGDLEDGTTYTRDEVLQYLEANALQVVPATFADLQVSGKAIRDRADALFAERIDRAVDAATNAGLGPEYSYVEPVATFNEEHGKWEVSVDGEDAGLFYDSEADALEAGELAQEARNATAMADFRTDVANQIPYPSEEAEQQLRDEAGDTPPHFAEYVMAGPQADYREVMLAVPGFGLKRPGESFEQFSVRMTGKRSAELTHDEWAAITELLVKGWQDGHREYDTVENPIVRLRFNTRTLADGRRVLFLEEVQPPQTEEFDKMPALFQKNWRDIALKWALHHAVEQGLDAVAWTPGDEQVRRYSLETKVDRIEWKPDGRGQNHKGLQVFVPVPERRGGGSFLWLDLEIDGEGRIVSGNISEQHVGKTLDVLIGKDLARQVLEGAPSGRLEGGTIAGGEGLRKLYDRDLGNTLKNLAVVKKGGGRLETVAIVRGFALTEPHGARFGATALEAQWRQEHSAPVTVDVPAIAITPEMRAQIEAGQPLFHGEDDAQGFIRFHRRDGRLEGVHIGLLRSADLSTFVHEVGHLAFELMGDLVEELQPLDPTTLSSTQKALMADYWNLVQAAATATGTTIESRDQIGEAQHEWIARAMETYVREGRAPSAELASSFARMSAWLLDIYKSLRRLVVMTPEVRGIFDRMLASDEAIAEAEHAAAIAPLFTDAQHAGMTDLGFASYQDKVREASVKKQAELRDRVQREFEREKTSWWREEQDAIRAQVERELAQDPAQRAVSILRRGVNPDGTRPDGTPLEEDEAAPAIKLSRESLVAQFGRAVLKRLPQGLYSADSGISADTAAAFFRDVGINFPSGDALVRALVATRPFNTVAAEETQQRMTAKHGDLMEGGGLRAAAQRIVEGEYHADVVQAELEALTKGMAATTIPSAAVINAAAERRIAQTSIRDLQPGLHLQAARRASKRAFDMLAKGNDRAGAIQAKLQELLNLALYRHARDAQEGVDSKRRTLQGYQTTAARQRFGKAGGTHLAQIDALMDRFELAPVTRKQTQRRAALAAYVERQRELNPDQPLDIDPALLDESRRQNYADMTVAQFQAVYEAIEQIAHIARLKNRMLKAFNQRTFEENRDALAASITTNNAVKALPIEETDRDKRLAKIGEMFASLSKMGHLARALDGHEDGGEMWNQISRPMNVAADEELVRKAVAGRRLDELQRVYSPLERRRMSTQAYLPGAEMRVSKEFRLMVALNWGNQDNRDRLLQDPTRGWNMAQVQAILDSLDERDWRYVQSVLDYIEEFWPEIAAKQQRVTGLEPEKVEALPIETRYGTFRGGYFPIVFDANRVARADAFSVANEAQLRMQAGYVSQATTRRGHTKARQRNVKMSLRLDFAVIGDHVEQVVHDLTHHEMLIDVGRLLGDSDVQAAIYTTRGPNVYRQFSAGLRDVAIGPMANKGMERAAGWLKGRSQLAGLALNFWTFAQQPLGVFNGARRVGPKWVARGMARWLKDAATMEHTVRWIWEVSPMMRHRGDTLSQDQADLRSKLARPGSWFDVLVRSTTRDKYSHQDLLDSFTWHIGIGQRFADVGTWLGMYEKAAADPANYLADGTIDQARVVALADQAVIDSQGSGHIKDLAQAQRGNAYAKLFMTFYSYGNLIYNDILDAAGSASKAKTTVGSVGTFLGHLSLLLVLPALGTVAISRATGRTGGRDDGDEHGWAYEVSKELLATLFNTMPFLREAGGSAMLAMGYEDATGARGYEGPAALRFYTTLNRAAQQFHQGELDEAATRAYTALTGLLFRLPASQVQKTMDGYVALEEGRTRNPMVLLVGAPRAPR